MIKFKNICFWLRFNFLPLGIDFLIVYCILFISSSSPSIILKISGFVLLKMDSAFVLSSVRTKIGGNFFSVTEAVVDNKIHKVFAVSQWVYVKLRQWTVVQGFPTKRRVTLFFERLIYVAWFSDRLSKTIDFKINIVHVSVFGIKLTNA